MLQKAAYHQQAMALLTASDLHKDIAGRPLLRGVSFKLERRERLTLAGRNGAGKTTLPGARASRCTTSARRASASARWATTSSPPAPPSCRSRPSCQSSSS